jgi:hypothetical protein
MFNISNYLQKLTKNLNSAEDQKKLIISIIKNKTQLLFVEDEIEIKNNVLLIKSSPGQKNKIFIYKNNIIEELKNSLNLIITDIR